MTRQDQDILNMRQQHFGRGLSLSYKQPLTIVRGEGQYLFDSEDKRFLDCINNVCHVGHCHPQVVEAINSQAKLLNTNTRYLHPLLAEYVTELAARFPDPLNVVYLVNSGSEANELALRLAKSFTGAKDVIALEGAYHGHTQAVLDISHYKFSGAGGAGCPAATHVAAMPCVFRGKFRDRSSAGTDYAGEVAQLIASMLAAHKQPAAFIAESLLSVGGQVVLPAGYLAGCYQAVREAGGVCIADEVQVGFGRVGEKFWGFELQDVVPDIVTLGKPIGNGHPLGAVVTTPEIAAAFDNGMEYFNTYGGNPVSCAAGLAVLQVIDNQKLVAHAQDTGSHILTAFTGIQQRHDLVGDVRGLGLFIGLELVRDSDLTPAKTEAYELVERAKDRGVLLSVDGPLENVIKFKPPMVFDRTNADLLIQVLDEELAGL